MKRIETAVGTMEIDGDGAAITRVRFVGADIARKADKADTADVPGETGADGVTDPLLERAAAELKAWFAGTLREFTVPVALDGARPEGARSASKSTPFRLAVWNAIRSIPYGETRTYGEVARMIGKPLAARAVGQALNRNPVAIIVPCHRVIGGDGSLVGFGGGLERKRLLLAIEGIY
jgi:methylated-DNA-[protein]-cysteine S-methyltransferase